MPSKIGFVEKLRAKPIAYRRTFAVLVSLVFTLIVFSIWSISTASKLAALNDGNNKAAVSDSLSVFSVIKNQFTEVMDKNKTSEDTYVDTTIYNEEASTSNDYLLQ